VLTYIFSGLGSPLAKLAISIHQNIQQHVRTQCLKRLKRFATFEFRTLRDTFPSSTKKRVASVVDKLMDDLTTRRKIAMPQTIRRIRNTSSRVVAEEEWRKGTESILRLLGELFPVNESGIMQFLPCTEADIFRRWREYLPLLSTLLKHVDRNRESNGRIHCNMLYQIVIFYIIVLKSFSMFPLPKNEAIYIDITSHVLHQWATAIDDRPIIMKSSGSCGPMRQMDLKSPIQVAFLWNYFFDIGEIDKMGATRHQGLLFGTKRHS
jgi:hypothetical protein